jgi:hypothetical protein
VHVPAQLAWFGPSCTTWMFSFERSTQQQEQHQLLHT